MTISNNGRGDQRQVDGSGGRWPASLFVAAVGLSVPATLYFRRPVPDAATVRFEVFPPARPGVSAVSTVELSPDGRRLAFMARPSGATSGAGDLRPFARRANRPSVDRSRGVLGFLLVGRQPVPCGTSVMGKSSAYRLPADRHRSSVTYREDREGGSPASEDSSDHGARRA